MKAVRVIILLFAMCSPALAEFGIKIEYGQTMDQASSIDCLLKYRFNIGPVQNISYAGWNTWFVFDYRQFSGYPARELYTFGNTIKYKSFYIDVTRFCSHRVVSADSKYFDYGYIRKGTMLKFTAGFEHWF